MPRLLEWVSCSHWYPAFWDSDPEHSSATGRPTTRPRAFHDTANGLLDQDRASLQATSKGRARSRPRVASSHARGKCEIKTEGHFHNKGHFRNEGHFHNEAQFDFTAAGRSFYVTAVGRSTSRPRAVRVQGGHRPVREQRGKRPSTTRPRLRYRGDTFLRHNGVLSRIGCGVWLLPWCVCGAPCVCLKRAARPFCQVTFLGGLRAISRRLLVLACRR